jgi:hypothetical protein
MTDFLFANPSFLTGAGRVIDLGASLERASYNLSRTPREADERAITQDWAAVGGDLAGAIENAKPEVTK